MSNSLFICPRTTQCAKARYNTMLFFSHIVSSKTPVINLPLSVRIVSDSQQKREIPGLLLSPLRRLWELTNTSQGWTRNPFHIWLQVFSVWQHIWKHYATNLTQGTNSGGGIMVNECGRHKPSSAHWGYYYMYKNQGMQSMGIFISSWSTASCLVNLLMLLHLMPLGQLQCKKKWWEGWGHTICPRKWPWVWSLMLYLGRSCEYSTFSVLVFSSLYLLGSMVKTE